MVFAPWQLPISIMSDGWNARARSFDRRAAQYDDVRPSYPREAIDEIMRFGGLQTGMCALEIGSGTGKATRLLLARGMSITGLEPGAELVKVATDACDGHVTFLNLKFEDWPLARASYDLVFAAQSFHWVDQQVGYTKAAEALRAGGTLALFWNRTKVVASPLQAQLEAYYEEQAPGLDELNPEVLAAAEESIAQSIVATGLFDAPTRVGFPWSDRLATHHYIRLLETYSAHAALAEAQRTVLLDGVAKLIDAAGGEIDVHYETVIHTARRRT